MATEEIVLLPDRQYTADSYGATTRVGGTTDHGVLADELDTTYLTTSFGTASGNKGNYIRRNWGFPAPTLPAGAIVEYLRAEWRSSRPRNDEGEGLAWSQAAVGIRQGSSYALGPPSVVVVRDDLVPRSYATPNSTKDASGRSWHSFGDLANFVVQVTARVEDRSSDLLDPRLYRVRLALSYNERPVVSGVGPTGTLGTSRPTLTWSYADPENDPKIAHRVLVFTSTQANPEASASSAVYDSGWVNSAFNRQQLPLLSNNTTYHAYVAVEQPAVAGVTQRSTYVSTSFSVSVAAPPAPAVAVSTFADTGRHRVTVTEQGLPKGDIVNIERSLYGLTWEPVRGATAAGYTGTSVAVNDYEVPLGEAPTYRAQLVDVVSAEEAYSSPWTSATGTALPQDRWWLKDPTNPALNRVVQVAPPFDLARPRPDQRTFGIGSDVAAVSHDGRRGVEGSITFRTDGKAAYKALEALLDSGRTLLLQHILGFQWFLSFGSASYRLAIAQPGAGAAAPIRHYHEITVAVIEVRKP